MLSSGQGLEQGVVCSTVHQAVLIVWQTLAEASYVAWKANLIPIADLVWWGWAALEQRATLPKLECRLKSLVWVGRFCPSMAEPPFASGRRSGEVSGSDKSG
jgi:hypothetical protein